MSSERRRVRLGDVVDLLTGHPFKSSEYTSSIDGIKLVRGDNVVQGRIRWADVKRWPSDRLENLSHYELAAGDVVLAMDRPWIELGLKFAAVRDEDLPALLVQRVARLRAREGLDQTFLRYVIGGRAFTDYILGVQTGTSIPHISGGQIRDFSFELPPLTEQRAIAKILGNLDEMIALNRSTNQTLQTLTAALFKSWFVDFDPVHAPMSASSANSGLVDNEVFRLFPRSFDQSPIGPIPSGWRYLTLGDIVTLQRGTTYKSALLDSPGPFLLGLGSIHRNGGFRGDSLRTYGGDSPDNLLLLPGDLYVSLKDVTQAGDLLGAVARVPKWLSAGRLTQDTVKLSFLDGASVSSTFVYWLLRTPRAREWFRSCATGTTNLALSREDFLKFGFAVPPAAALGVLDDFFSVATQRIEDVSESISLAAVRDSLLPRLMSGELNATQQSRGG